MADLCDDILPDYVAKECGIDQGGIIAIAFIDEDYEFDDFEDATEWADAQAASPQQVWVIQNTRGEYPGGTPTEEEGFGTELTRVTGADHELTVEVEGIKDNVSFFNILNRKQRSFRFAWVTNGGLLHVTEKTVTPYAKQIINRGINTASFWQIMVKWQDLSNPLVYDEPTGVFQ